MLISKELLDCGNLCVMFFIFIAKNLNITNYNMKNIIKLQTHTEAELCLHRWEQLQYHSHVPAGFVSVCDCGVCLTV